MKGGTEGLLGKESGGMVGGGWGESQKETAGCGPKSLGPF